MQVYDLLSSLRGGQFLYVLRRGEAEVGGDGCRAVGFHDEGHCAQKVAVHGYGFMRYGHVSEFLDGGGREAVGKAAGLFKIIQKDNVQNVKM